MRRPAATTSVPGRLARGVLVVALTAGATLGFAVTAGPAAAAPAGQTTITLYDINDLHGRIEPTGTRASDKAPIGGVAQIAGMLDRFRDAAQGGDPDAAFVSAGDNVGASTFVSAIQNDDPTLDALKAMGVLVSATGNHEFDKGYNDLVTHIQPRAGFPILGANVKKADGSDALPPSFSTTIKGLKVGFVGVVTLQTPSLVSPSGITGLTFTDPITAANAEAAKLKAAGDEVVVLLAHEGAPTSNDCSAVASDATFGPFTKVSGDIDAVLSGHTHQTYACTITDPSGFARPVLQTGNYGANLGKITLTYDSAAGDVVAGTAENIPTVGYPADPAVATIVSTAVAQSAVLGKEQIGSITADITRAKAADGEEDRGSESSMGNFIADVQLAGTADAGRGGAQLALMNPGGLRADLLVAGSADGGADGVITYSEAFSVQPFANDVFTKTYTGQQIKDALEQQWQPAGASRPILHLGVSKGFRYEYVPDAPAGQHVVAATMTLNGQSISLAGTYRVTVNSFLAAGGDNFAVLGQGTGATTTGDNDLTMLVAYLRANSPVTADAASRSSVYVADPNAPGGSGTVGSSNGRLPATGGDPLPLLGVGVGLLLAGAGALRWGRRPEGRSAG